MIGALGDRSEDLNSRETRSSISGFPSGREPRHTRKADLAYS